MTPEQRADAHLRAWIAFHTQTQRETFGTPSPDARSFEAGFLAGCRYGAYAATERADMAEQDARRYRLARNCVRRDNFGAWVIHEDDPHTDDVIKQQFDAAIDAAIAEQEGE